MTLASIFFTYISYVQDKFFRSRNDTSILHVCKYELNWVMGHQKVVAAQKQEGLTSSTHLTKHLRELYVHQKIPLAQKCCSDAGYLYELLLHCRKRQRRLRSEQKNHNRNVQWFRKIKSLLHEDENLAILTFTTYSAVNLCICTFTI